MKSVILILLVFLTSECLCGFQMYKSARSVGSGAFSVNTPCPSVFQYITDRTGDIMGTIKVDPFEHNGSNIQLDVELSVGNSVHGYNGKIVLAESRNKVINDIFNRKPVYYNVHFPAWQGIVPKVTKIVVNGNLICSGPRIPIQMVPVLTTINLQHKLSLGITPLASPADPTIEGSFNNLAPEYGDIQPTASIDIRGDNGDTVDIIEIDATQDGKNNAFLNNKNPFLFKPQGPPPSRPSFSTELPQTPPPSRNPNEAFPQNPFFNPLSTPQPQAEESVQIEDNQFFNERTTETSITLAPQIPQRGKPSSNSLADVSNICGRPIAINSLVFNGQSVPRGAFPWLVAIFRQLENVSLKYICSGSLVSSRHVITAAHCVKLETRRIKANELLCMFGKLNIGKFSISPGERMLEPEAVIIHPEYEIGTANADIAVLVFPDPIEFTKLIRPICLWSGSNELNLVVGKEGIVVGWGRNEEGDISTEPRQIGLPIVSQESCLRSDKNSGSFLHITSNTTFCAGHRDGSGPCNGDSGSGFLMRRDGVFYLRGIVSTALSDATHRSCNLKEYVVFTDASKYLDWLLDIMR